MIPVEKIKNNGGGKALGLAFLKQNGMNIPETFVITGNKSRQEIEHFVNQLPEGKVWAVRSSADAEDGTDLSFAGQFQSYLNIKGKEQILAAIDKCFASAKSETISAYAENMQTENSGMNVLLQEMIFAEYSGVIFTVDPVNNRHDTMVISLIKGTGEDLMAGTKNGEDIHLLKAKRGKYESLLLKPNLFHKIIEEAIEIEKLYGKPADLEWAIDQNGKLFWLQLRPVTGLKLAHFNELDTKPVHPAPIYTRGNIGEMMPGPVTPLTLSTFAKSIDYGLQVFYKAVGAIPKIYDYPYFVHSFYNHLFFDVNSLYTFVPNVLLSKKENIDFSVISNKVPDVHLPPKASFLKRVKNFINMLKYLKGGAKADKELENLYRTFKIECSDDYRKCYTEITRKLPVLDEAWSLHYVSSSESGSNYTAILNIYTGNKIPTSEDQEKVAKFFTDIPDIESAQVLKAIDELADMTKNLPDIEEKFLNADGEKSLDYLKNEAPENVKTAWSNFMKRHGHRGVREGELIEQEWAQNPASIIEGIKAKIKLFKENKEPVTIKEKEFSFDLSKEPLNFLQKQMLKKLIPKARKSVARREHTKALAIGVQYQFKLAYRHLAKLLVKAGLLDDEQQIFFLQHDEIDKLINEDTAHWKKLSAERMALYPEMKNMVFKDLIFGIPVPEETVEHEVNTNLQGIAVSRGLVEGKARIISSTKQAAELQAGEIMVVQFTDIGWTPYYSIAGGLITEIGSPLSHGAVVAREYGLPTLVSVKGAMKQIKNGQRIRLDAGKGKVELLN